MAFQFIVSPGISRVPGLTAKKVEEETPVLCLAPFTPSVKLSFDNILVGTSSTQTIIVKNTTVQDKKVTVNNIPLPEHNLHLSWYANFIPAREEVLLEITWSPIAEVGWRHVFTFEEGRHLQKDLVVTFKSFSKKKANKSIKPKPGVISSKIKSIFRKVSPKSNRLSPPKNISSKTEKPKASYTITNKENIIPTNGMTCNQSTTCSSHSRTFNINSPNTNLQRTYTLTPQHAAFNERKFLHNVSNFLLEPDFVEENNDVAQLQSTPLNSMDFASKLEFTPFTTGLDKRMPNVSNFECKIAQVIKECDLEMPENVDDVFEDSLMGNLSSATYTKCHLSSSTYTKGNLSTETYIKENLSLSPSTQGNTFIDDMGKQHGLEADGLDFFQGDCILSLSPIGRSSIIPSNRLENPIPTNLLTTAARKTLYDIQEEHSGDEPFKVSCVKRKATWTFDTSPPKKPLLFASKPIVPHRNSALKWKKMNRVQSDWKPLNIDPFLTPSLHHTEEWQEAQELHFKNWLNALLKPPTALDSDVDGHPLDVAKLWQQCQHKAVSAAPAKDLVANDFHTNQRLESLRKSAKTLFRSREISDTVSGVIKIVESGKLSIRADKNIHLDISLQSEIMNLFLSYNPLWLRIGLETIYDVGIQLNSNSDRMGLSGFLMCRFFKDPQLISKHKRAFLPKYANDIKKLMLKKFLSLVYFLDYAKSKMLIPHDPCLFCKNAPIKESREILLRFSRELLSAVGDITKPLRFIGYVVNHKQTYIHEFDYSLVHLGSDLRDGIRLTKVMELILLRSDIVSQLRGPAISRLQKLHNMKIVFHALHQSEFLIVGDIQPKDIVDGHWEKTLSFLWQIIYKFQAPRLIAATKTIQNWWRSLRMVILRRVLTRTHRLRERAACKIQQWYRRCKFSQKLVSCSLMFKRFAEEKKRTKSVIKIQSYYRMYVDRSRFMLIKRSIILLQSHARRYLVHQDVNKKIAAIIRIQAFIRMWIKKTHYLKLRVAAIVIQRSLRAYWAMKSARANFLELRAATIVIQQRFRALKAMEVDRFKYREIKKAVTIIQNRFQANKAMKLKRLEFIALKKATLFIQRRFRAKAAMRLQFTEYHLMRDSAVLIQQRFRAYLLMKSARTRFMELKKSTLVVQQRFRANKSMQIERRKYLELRKYTLIVQQRFRANVAMKVARINFLELRETVIVIQQRFRANVAMKVARTNFLELRETVIVIQQRFRANVAMKVARTNFLELREKAIVIQQRFRANVAMKVARTNFLELRETVIVIQQRFRANVAMKVARTNFLELREKAIVIQQRFRANVAMKVARTNFLELREKAIVIQQRFRANVAMKVARTNFLELREKAIVIQQRFRANVAMKVARTNFLELREKAIVIQQRFRANVAMKVARTNFLELREKAIVIQQRFRANVAMKVARTNFLELREKAIVIQQRFRANVAMKVARTNFLELREKAIVIQQRFRANVAMKVARTNFLELREKAIVIQQRFRANVAMKVARTNFLELRETVIVIQQRFRANVAMKVARTNFLELREKAIVIQQRFRANVAMKVARTNFLELREKAIVIQQRFRANVAMKVARANFLELRAATIVIQQRFRALKAMEVDRFKYREIKKAVTIIQTRFQANKAMKLKRLEFIALKEATLFMQRRFRAKTAMRLQFTEYHLMRDSAVIIQQRFRAYLLMKSARTRFMELKKSTLVIQQRFRANKSMQIERSKYLELRKYTLIVQQRFRANVAMKVARTDFLELRETAIVIQQRFRALKAMKIQFDEYHVMKRSAITIQQRFRANRAMKTVRAEFISLKQAVCTIQQRFRANRAMKCEQSKYQEIKRATLMIQERFRAKRAMVLARTEFIRLKVVTLRIQEMFRANRAMNDAVSKYQEVRRAVIVIQTRFRAYKTMEAQRTEFLRLRKAAIVIQRTFRANQAMKIQVFNYQLLRRAASIIQQRFRANKQRNKESRQDEEAVQNTHATKIQTMWRAYRVRKNHPEMERIRRNCQEAAASALPSNTLGERRERAMDFLLTGNVTVAQINRSLEELDFISRRCTATCVRLSKSMPARLYAIVAATNRSFGETETCALAASILINLYKNPATSHAVWLPQEIDNLITVMLHYCDKDTQTFPNLCTLMWLFAHNVHYKLMILAMPKYLFKLHKIRSMCLRQQKMTQHKVFLQNSRFNSYCNLTPSPSLLPDWGVDYPDRPRTFYNSLHALNCLWKVFDLDCNF